MPEAATVWSALEAEGDVAAAAHRLGVHRNTLYSLLRLESLRGVPTRRPRPKALAQPRVRLQKDRQEQ